MKALVDEIDTVLGMGSMTSETQGLLYGAKGRLYLSMAYQRTFPSPLHAQKTSKGCVRKESQIGFEKSKESPSKAETFFSKAQVSIAALNEAGFSSINTPR